jgi:hypothetical protein
MSFATPISPPTHQSPNPWRNDECSRTILKGFASETEVEEKVLDLKNPENWRKLTDDANVDVF